MRLGLNKHVRNPGSIVNIEHHDPSGSQKSANGIPATIKSVIATSTTATPLEPAAMLWVVNRDTSVQYIYVGKISTAPATVDASNGMALPPNAGILMCCGKSDDDKISMSVKTSNALVHVTVLEV